jgi:hypothetical protein
MEETKKEFEWTLKWSGRPITECSIAAFKACEVFHIWKDYNLKVIDYAEYQQMIADGLIEQCTIPSSWTVREGEHALAAKTYVARQYGRTWEELSNCYRDFEMGWLKCEERYDRIAQHEHALKLNKEFDAWKKRVIREITFEFPEHFHISYNTPAKDHMDCTWDDIEPLKAVVRYHRVKKPQLILTVRCTGEQIEQVIREVNYKYGRDMVPIKFPQEPETKGHITRRLEKQAKQLKTT